MAPSPGTALAADAWRGRQVLVTGATGFIGRHVTRRLVQAGAHVVALIRDPTRATDLSAMGVRCVPGDLGTPDTIQQAASGCSHIFHVAGRVQFDGDWKTATKVHVDGTRAVVEAARAAGVRRLIHTSSIVAIGASHDGTPLDERSSWNLADRHVSYVTTKHQAEEVALAAADRDLEVVVVNPGSVIGPHDPFESEFGRFCRHFWRHRVPYHFGGGNCFVDVRDVATGQLLAAERGTSGERYILGGANVSTGAFFAALARQSPERHVWIRLPAALAPAMSLVERAVRSVRGRPSYLTPERARIATLIWYFRSDKARVALGYEPRPLAETIADTYRDLRSNW